MKKLIIIAMALVASMSFAAGKKDAKAAVKMDVTGSLKWTGYGVGKSHAGDLTIKSGSVELKGEELVGGEFVIDMTSLKTGDSPKLEGHLKSPDFFDVEKFKEGTFKITKVESIKGGKAGDPTHKITGDLTIKGKTHKEVFAASITKEGKGFAASAATEIKDRTQYDIIYNSGKFKAVSALGDKLIQDNIKVELNVKTK
ncbi:YceI family protein [bacterium]|nr:YceI family protein [bacterium]